MNSFPSHRGILRRTAPLVSLLLAAGAIPNAWADKIVTKNGQTIEGVVRDENDFYVNIETKGIITSVPRERIRTMEKVSAEENSRLLLDHAQEALTKNDVSAARNLVEQVRTIGSHDGAINERLGKLDQEITKMEQSGGSPEERRRRAETLLQRANEAFDRIRNEEGNEFLIQALKAFPESSEAQSKINERLSRRGTTDLMLAARYFSEVLAPNKIAPPPSLIAILPDVYSDLVQRFDTTTDTAMSGRYVEWIKAINQAFQENASWVEGADEEQAALIKRPLNEVLRQIVENNLGRQDYENALQKLESWANPQNSAEEALVVARANIGVHKFEEAEKVLDEAQTQFPTVSSLRLQYNALTLMIKGFQALDSGNQELGVQTLEQVYNNPADLLPEISVSIGQQLAKILAPLVDQASPADAPWRQADAAAVVMKYGQGDAARRNAARVLSSAIHSTPWNLNYVLRINGIDVPLTEALAKGAESAFSPPLGIRANPSSTFRAEVIMNLSMPQAEADRLIGGLGADLSGFVSPAVNVPRVEFQVTASQPSLGNVLNEKWSITSLPAAVAQRRAKDAAPGVPDPLAPGAPPVAVEAVPITPPEPTPAPTPALTPAPAPEAAPATAAAPTSGTMGVLGLPQLLGAAPTSGTLIAATPRVPPAATGNGLINLSSSHDLDLFFQHDVVDFLSPGVMLMTSHLRIPLIEMLLTDQVIIR